MNIELTKNEMEMLFKALDFYGDKVADSQGYSSAEPYWDLKDFLSNKMNCEESVENESCSNEKL